MHAARIERHGPLELTWSEATLPAPGPDQVLIDVHTAGVNYPDVLVVQGTYQNLAPLPFSPGKEVAGVVRSAGARVVSCRPGDRVVALIENGGYAEQVLAPAVNTYVLPGEIDFVTAATTLAYQTAHFALLERGGWRAGQSVLVTGATGLHWSDYRDRDPDLVRRVQDEILELLRSRRLKPPIAAIYPMERAVEALRQIAGRAVMGKLVLVTDAGRRAGIRTGAFN